MIEAITEFVNKHSTHPIGEWGAWLIVVFGILLLGAVVQTIIRFKR